MRFLNLTLRLSVLATLTSAPFAQTLNETYKLLPNQVDTEDRFGTAVAIEGDRILVGAWGDKDNNLQAGAAFLIDSASGQVINKIFPSDIMGGQFFGSALAIHGSTAIIGGYGLWSPFPYMGSAYLFDTVTGQQISKLQPGDGQADDEFGGAVAINSTSAVVGAIGDDDKGTSCGAAYVFDKATGQLIKKIYAKDAGVGDRFGCALALDGSLLAAGAKLDNDKGNSSGSVYLFDMITVRQVAKIMASDGAPGDEFGASLAADNGILIVGAAKDDDNGADSGSAYLFDMNTGQELVKLLPNDGLPGDHFGWAVSISGSTAAVSAFLSGTNGQSSGAAYLFDVQTGQQLAKLLPSDGDSFDFFGQAICINGSSLIVGAENDEVKGFASGSTYVYELEFGATAVNNGAGGNLLVLSDGGNAPRIGQTWPIVVDTATSGHTLSACYFYAGALAPGTAFFNGGEVLVDLLSAFAYSNTVVGTGLNDHSVLIPNDVGLIGVKLTVQAALFTGTPALVLGNALDITIGL